MSTEDTKKGGNPLTIFVVSLCAAIVMAGGFAIVIEAFILAAANLFELGSAFVWVASGANAELSPNHFDVEDKPDAILCQLEVPVACVMAAMRERKSSAISGEKLPMVEPGKKPRARPLPIAASGGRVSGAVKSAQMAPMAMRG